MEKYIEKLNSTQKKLALLIAGLIANFAFAPFDFFPILFISFPLFMLILQTAVSRKQAFWFAWWFGFGHFLAGLYWVSNSLLVDADRFGWMIPFAAAGIPSILAIYTGLAGMAFFVINKRYRISQLAQILIFINLWLLTEFARNYLFTGFPWNLIGYTLLFNINIVQIASVGGVFLASWIALLFAFLPLFWRSRRAMIALILLAVGIYSYGAYRIENTATQALHKTVKLVQPNIKQTLAWDPQLLRNNFQESIELMSSGKPADYIIWPEAAGIYHLNRVKEALYALEEATPSGSLLIVGADRSVGDRIENYQAWNAMYVISDRGIQTIYDKQHLVPFGEYVPLSKILPLDKITGGMVDFSSGEGERKIDVIGLNALPLICYEIIFTNYIFSATSDSNTRPNFIINITNDAWFGNSTGPYQHLAMTRMRAIEAGIPVLRAAKTGISAIVDSFGKVTNSLGLNQKGVIVSDVPEKIADVTIYSKLKLWLISALLLGSSLIIAFFRKP